jgi:hypothetical protein
MGKIETTCRLWDEANQGTRLPTNFYTLQARWLAADYQIDPKNSWMLRLGAICRLSAGGGLTLKHARRRCQPTSSMRGS